jgi:hypothetical protein
MLLNHALTCASILLRALSSAGLNTNSRQRLRRKIRAPLPPLPVVERRHQNGEIVLRLSYPCVMPRANQITRQFFENGGGKYFRLKSL